MIHLAAASKAGSQSTTVIVLLSVAVIIGLLVASGRKNRKAGRPPAPLPVNRPAARKVTRATNIMPLTAAEMAEYQRLLADDLPGAEQSAMRQRDPQAYDEWLGTQLRHVPMPSAQKPDINGFREGDRVRLVRPFIGETVSYESGRTGIFLIKDTSPAQIRLGREGFYDVVVDGPDGQLIIVTKNDVEKIPGHADVLYADDGESVRIVHD